MDSISLALDWTPNTNHTPILLAHSQGHYAAANIAVRIISPATDDYSTTPAQKLANGDVDIALCPSESIISHRTSSHPALLKAVATLLARDASAIAALGSSSIKNARDLDGKRYASYGARFEEATVRELVRAGGGKGDFEVVKPPKLGIFGALMDGHADATWIFPAWEGVEAMQKGVDLVCFPLGEYSVPYGYSPVLAVNEARMKGKEDVLRRFLAATRKGAEKLMRDWEQAVGVIERWVPAGEKGLVWQSMRSLMQRKIFSEREWGKMEGEVLEKWVSWLKDKDLVKDRDGNLIDVSTIGEFWTNDYLPR